MRKLFGILAFFALSACNYYADYFQESGEGLKSEYVLYNAEPTRVIQSGDNSLDGRIRDREHLWEQGYALIGYSGFNGSDATVSSDFALTQGKKIGAAVVMYYAKYQSTRTGTTTIPTTSTVTTTSPYTGRSYTSTVQTTRTETYSIDRYDTFAGFYAKLKDVGMGTLVREPSGDEQQKYGTNKGVIVQAVRRGSAGYQAEILPGDLIIALNGQVIDSVGALQAASSASRGQEVVLTIRRTSGEVKKRVMVRAG